MRKMIKEELKGFRRLNRAYLDSIDEIFKKQTGRSFYDLLAEEKEISTEGK